MADTPSGGEDKFGFLTRKLGPMPVWVWGVLAVGVYYWYTHYGPGANSAATAPNTSGDDITETLNTTTGPVTTTITPGPPPHKKPGKKKGYYPPPYLPRPPRKPHKIHQPVPFPPPNPPTWVVTTKPPKFGVNDSGGRTVRSPNHTPPAADSHSATAANMPTAGRGQWSTAVTR